MLDEEGFLYPKLSASECSNCGMCRLHCPIIQETRNKDSISYYGVIHKDVEVTNDSASGGAFTAIADYVLSQNGVVFGCAFNENIEAITISVCKTEDLHQLRGSKYVQCNTNDQYKKIKEYLQDDKLVMYCSTPCQIAGLKSYLKKDYDKLILVDLLCHGTPSPGLFKKYIDWLSQKYRGKIIEYSFRDKRFGWGTKGHFTTDEEHELLGSDPYYYSFLMGRTYRPVCYQCKYAASHRTGDFTIGDFWGVENYYPEIPRENGVSAVLINTIKAQTIFDRIKSNVYYFETFVWNTLSPFCIKCA